jgi:hypothetical protein
MRSESMQAKVTCNKRRPSLHTVLVWKFTFKFKAVLQIPAQNSWQGFLGVCAVYKPFALARRARTGCFKFLPLPNKTRVRPGARNTSR